MKPPWLNFKEIRGKLDFAAVLKHYGVELKLRRGEQHQGFCPLPTHSGQKRSPSFSANIKQGCWHCFGCGAHGNVIDFCARMEGMDPEKGSDVRKAALLIQDRFFGGTETVAASTEAQERKPEKKVPAQQSAGQAATCAAIVNAPLDFQLQALDSEHPYLKERGFTAETILHFGLGYCSRGSLQGRIAIPIHDEHGKLVGYAGRIVDDSQIGDEHPKYKFPGPREREGKRYEFHKSLILYNGFAAGDNLPDLIVVEGFPSVWWLWQCGFPHVVALMGASCSEEQALLILEKVRADGRVWVFPDGDEAGVRCATSVLLQVSPHRFTRWAQLDGGAQPTDCTADELSLLLDGKGGGNARPDVAAGAIGH